VVGWVVGVGVGGWWGAEDGLRPLDGRTAGELRKIPASRGAVLGVESEVRVGGERLDFQCERGIVAVSL